MAFGEFSGRLQKITQGRVDDLVLAYYLACHPRNHINKDLKVLIDGEHHSAIQVIDKLGFLGTMQGLVVGIASADPVEAGVEQIPVGEEEHAIRFLDPEQNKRTYFERMIAVKRSLYNEGIPLNKIDVLPHFPSRFFPTIKGFETYDVGLMYLGIEQDHHWDRVDKKKNKPGKAPYFYHDFRGTDTGHRDPNVTKDISNEVFNFYHRRFILGANGLFEDKVRETLDVLFEDSARTGTELVLGIVCYPTQADRDEAGERWQTSMGKGYDEVMKLTPFDDYQILKSYLIQQGVDLSKTHITFMQPDILLGKTPSRCEGYMPGKFVFCGEVAYNANSVVKNARFSEHSNCVGTKLIKSN